MSKGLAYVAGVLLAAASLYPLMRMTGTGPVPMPDGCAGPRLSTVEQRDAAFTDGYEIRADHGCIDKQSAEVVQRQQREYESARARKVAHEREGMARSGAGRLAQERHGFHTAVALREPDAKPLPAPPAGSFVRSDYRNLQNDSLPAFVTPNPRDGRRHPAIVWLPDGDGNSLADFWASGSPAIDASLRALTGAGIIVLVPTLRGSHGQDSPREFLFGEVDDVIASARQLAKLSYVQPDRIYLGGLGTGATLALLVAAMPSTFKAVFAFGSVTRADHYTARVAAINYAILDPMEHRLRSPVHWLDGIVQPSYLIEGTANSSQLAELNELCESTSNPRVVCIRLSGADRDGALEAVTRVLAPRLSGDVADDGLLAAAEFAR